MPDYPLGQTLDKKFTTRAFATGIPTVLAGTPVIQIYEDNDLTQITAGITLTVDFDGVVGYNNVRIVATGANGFEAGKSYSVMISTGTVGGVSVVGEEVWAFSIERSPVNWANVTAPTTAVDLSGTDTQLVDTVTTYTGDTPQTGDNFARLGAPAGASVSADIAVIEGQTDDIGVAGAGLTAIDLPNQTMDIVGDITGNLSGSVGSVTAEVTADVTAISGDSVAADRLEAMMDGIIVAQVNDAAATTTAFAADGFTEATNDHFNGRLITFITGALTGQQTDIADYDAAGGPQGSQEFTVTALTEAPANNDFFVIH